MSLIIDIVVLVACNIKERKIDIMRERVIWGSIAILVFIPFLLMGGLVFQIFVGILAMIGVSEMFKMKGIEFLSFEGVLAMLASFFLVVPLDLYLINLPASSNFLAFGLVAFLLLVGTVFSKEQSYSFEDAAYPIAASFYVGFGLHNLVNARIAGIDKVLLAAFIVWATDTGAYLIGMRFGKRKLIPHVSPNKTIEGSLGGVLTALLVSFVFMIFDKSVYAPHHFFVTLILVIIFSVFAQLGDLVESAIKRHFGVKDSGKLIPGHGGILDRLDSMIFVFPIMHLLGLF